MKATIRNMMKKDTDRVGELLFESFNTVASKYGYAQKMKRAESGTSWAWALLHHGSNEVLIAEAENRVAGICCLNPRGNLGGVGPVAVDPSFQGYGIGLQLMQTLLQKAENLQSLRLIQEAFNPGSFSFYYNFDFLPVENLLDLCREKDVEQHTELCANVSEATAHDFAAIMEYDIPRSKSDRSADIAYFARWGKVFVYRNQAEICGYLVCLPGSESVQLGPLLADGEQEAVSLFQHAVAAFKNKRCQTRIMARNNVLVKALTGLGFKIYCIDTLMVRGPWRPGNYVEALGIFPEGV